MWMWGELGGEGEVCGISKIIKECARWMETQDERKPSTHQHR
jgi:hypothetical protein